jgi:4-amino-4-deoxy-L-arabinose transferase-like glycosyltransferase
MNEPTILDYIKSIFKSWNSFTDFLSALFQKKDATQMNDATQMGEFTAADEIQPAASEPEAVVPVQAAPRSLASFQRIPWLVLGVLFFALMGQLQFEPPQDLYPIGIFCYLIALCLAVVAFVKGQWGISTTPASETRTDSFAIRTLPFVISLLLSALTFYFMSENRFNATNVTLWILTLVFHILAFWVSEPRPQGSALINPIKWLSQNEWKFTITRRGVLLFVVFAFAAFFGFYKLYSLPDNMTSDHAEKLLDVYDITEGEYSIFFPRNTGREPLQFYLVAFLSQWFGISFLSLKVSTALMGMLTMIYIYLLGKELGGERVGLLAVAFAGIACWPVLIDRIGLRFAYYTPFTAAAIYYFIRGLRLQRRNEFILAGIALGIGLNGYTPMRIVPLAMIVFFVVYLLHIKDAQSRKQALVWFGLMAFTAWIFMIPLTRYALEFPDLFGERAFSRLGTIERPFPGPVWQIFLQNVWTGLRVYNWYGGEIWTFTLTNHRPAFDLISAALFLVGMVVLVFRYIRNRTWQDMMLLLAIPLLQLPSTLALAFPEENPALNRMSASFVPAFLLVAIALDTIMKSLTKQPDSISEGEVVIASPSPRSGFAVILVLGLFAASLFNNYDLIFNQYEKQFKLSNWNTRDMGLLMKDFIDKGGRPDQAWIVPYPYWSDTRLPLFWAETIYRGESAINPDQLADTVSIPGTKLFMLHIDDSETLEILRDLYPDGVTTIYQAEVPSKNFYVFRVSSNQ